MLLLAGLLVCSLATFATESSQNDGSMLLAQYQSQEQAVWASYVSNGRLASIKILIRGNEVVAYANGSMYGRDNWQYISPKAPIKRTHPNYDGAEIARQFNNRADLYISGRTVPVYF